jgi:hypothetical protein
MSHRRFPWFALALWAVLASLPAPAQNTTGAIAGIVRDPTGAVVAGARVTVRNQATGLIRTAETSGEGLYRVALLPAGS